MTFTVLSGDREVIAFELDELSPVFARAHKTLMKVGNQTECGVYPSASPLRRFYSVFTVSDPRVEVVAFDDGGVGLEGGKLTEARLERVVEQARQSAPDVRIWALPAEGSSLLASRWRKAALASR